MIHPDGTAGEGGDQSEDMTHRKASSERLLTLEKSLKDLLMSCESGRVAECCGWVEAYEFSPSLIQGWLKDHPDQQEIVRDQLQQLVLGIGNQSEELLCSRDFHATWSKAVALRFFGDILGLVKGLT